MSNNMIELRMEHKLSRPSKKQLKTPTKMFIFNTKKPNATDLFLDGRNNNSILSKNLRNSKHRAEDITSIPKILTTIFLLLVSCSNKAEGVVKVPSFQDVQAALESTICTVREEIVNIRDIHPSLPPDALFTPSCVKIMKCSGCCQSDSLVCKPTVEYTTEVQFLRQFESRKSFEYITLNFTHHEECACLNAYEPECIQHECSANEIWNQEKCKCVDRCTPRDCGPRKQWNPDRCQCVCSPCHPDILFHLRFNQDRESCSCECRRKKLNMKACAKRGAHYSRDHCRCASLNSFRGRRGY